MSDFIYCPPTLPWLEILYQDKDIIVIDKPSGLLSIPGRNPAHRNSVYARILAEHPKAHVVDRQPQA